MRENWEIKKLAQVSGFQNGFAFKSKTFKEEGIPVIRITNIQDQSIDFSKVVYVNPKDYDKDLTKYHIVKGDLLIAMSGATTGKIGINNSDNIALLNQRVGKFEPNEDLLKLFLYYFLSTKVEESLAISAGSAQPNLSTEQIKSFEIPIPPIEEQKEIVEILDQAFESIEKAKANIERNIENAKELFQSKLNEIFSQTGKGWKETTLGEISDIQRGSSPRPKGDPKYFSSVESDFNWITISDISSYCQNNTLLQTKEWLTEEGSKKSRYVEKNEFIIAVSGSSTGKCCLTGIKGYIYDGLAVVKNSKNLIESRFLLHYMMNSYTKINNSKSGAAFPNINTTYLKNFSIVLPSLKEQKDLILSIDNLDSLINSSISNYKKELENLEELKKSILQKAFSGELTNKSVAA